MVRQNVSLTFPGLYTIKLTLENISSAYGREEENS